MRANYTCLAEHPDLAEIQAVLARIPVLTDAELTALASAWHNTSRVAKARSRALAPDALLVVDILRCFDDIANLYAEDLEGEASYLTVEPAVVMTALKAVRDAVAAAIAQPLLSRREIGALSKPWRTVIMPVATGVSAPSGRIDALMRAVVDLGDRCHDTARAAEFERILCGAITRDRDACNLAIETAFALAVRGRQRRNWLLLRASVERALVAHTCRRCPPSVAFDSYDRERVATLCADAVCGLLVSDLLPGRHLDVLLEPLSSLIPFPRPPLGA